MYWLKYQICRSTTYTKRNLNMFWDVRVVEFTIFYSRYVFSKWCDHNIIAIRYNKHIRKFKRLIEKIIYNSKYCNMREKKINNHSRCFLLKLRSTTRQSIVIMSMCRCRYSFKNNNKITCTLTWKFTIIAVEFKKHLLLYATSLLLCAMFENVWVQKNIQHEILKLLIAIKNWLFCSSTNCWHEK